MNLALLTVQFGRLGPLNYSNICDRRFRSGERCRLLLDFTDGRADDSRDVSLLVSLFIVLVIAAPPVSVAADTFVPKVRQVRRRSCDRYSSSISRISAKPFEIRL